MSRYRKVPVQDLVVDRTYQRTLDKQRVQQIVDNFNPALLGTLEVSVRNGKAAVFDGQHRLAALRKLKMSDAPCLVHEGLSIPEEAMLFVQLQTKRKALRPLDRFRARIRAGEEAAVAIENTVLAHDYTIAEGSHEKCIGAVTALDRVYDRGGVDLLDETLNLLDTWRGEPRGTDGALIEGLAVAIQRYSGDKRWEGIRSALEGITATSLLRKAVASLETGGGSASRPQAVARQVGRLVGIRGPYKKAKAA